MKLVADASVQPSYQCGYQFAPLQQGESEIACSTLRIVSSFRRALQGGKARLLIEGHDSLLLAQDTEYVAQYRWDRVGLAGLMTSRATANGYAPECPADNSELESPTLLRSEAQPGIQDVQDDDIAPEPAGLHWGITTGSQEKVEASDREGNICDTWEFQKEKSFTALQQLVLLHAVEHCLAAARNEADRREIYLIAASHRLVLSSQVQYGLYA